MGESEQLASRFGMMLPEDKIREIDEVLARKGVTLSPISRYGKARALLLQPRELQQDRRAVLHATLDVTQFHVIVTVFADDAELWPTIERFLAKEPQIPVLVPQTTWRDYQTEFFLGAFLRYNGLPVMKAEPDWLAQSAHGPLGIAVKRIKNLDRLEERVREARRQIDREGLPGIVVVDLSPVLPDYYGASSVIRPQELGETTRRFLEETLSQRKAGLMKAAKSNSVLAITAFALGFSIDPRTTARTMCLRMSTKGLVDEGDVRLRFIRLYFERYELPSALDGLLKSVPSVAPSSTAVGSVDELTSLKRLANMVEYEYLAGHFDEASHHADQLIEVSRREHNFPGTVQALLAKGVIQEARGNYDDALALYRDALASIEPARYPDEIAHIEVNIGRTQVAKGDFGSAESLLIQAILTLQKGLNSRYLALAYSALGSLYLARRSGPAEENFWYVLALGQIANDRTVVADACRGLSKVYALRQETRRAEQLIEHAILEERAAAEALRDWNLAHGS
jgi:tetratricopeptide (TPR) repeat protein